MFSNKTYNAQIRELFACRRMGIRPALPPIRKLLKVLGNPQKRIRFFHVAGTNGKGSTTGAIARILMEAGYVTGAFFSPHVSDYRERITVNGRMISKKEVAETLARMGSVYKKALENGADVTQKITFFEWTAALAICHFAAKGVDVAVMETGMGGRFDATNVIKPLVSVITNVSLEHTAFLGKTVAQIAFEKSGIIKPGRPLICGVKQASAQNVVIQTAEERQSPLSLLGRDFKVTGKGEFSSNLCRRLQLKPAMPGVCQLENSALAAQAALAADGIEVSPENIETGISKNVLPGRFEVERFNGMEIVYDVAHNPPAVKELVRNITRRYPNRKFRIVFGVLKGKNYPMMLKLLAPAADRMVCIQTADFRAVPANEIASAARKTGIRAVANRNGNLRPFLNGKSPILVTGSFTVVEAVKKAVAEGL